MTSQNDEELPLIINDGNEIRIVVAKLISSPKTFSLFCCGGN